MKIRDPMRGPFGSLIAQLSKNGIKKRFPHRFLLSSGALFTLHSACQSGGAAAFTCGLRIKHCKQNVYLLTRRSQPCRRFVRCRSIRYPIR
jgi:hypothetical protein